MCGDASEKVRYEMGGELVARMTVLRQKGRVMRSMMGGAGVSGRSRSRTVVGSPGIPSLTLSCQGMFEPYLKSFYIRSTDPTQIKILKVSAWPLIPANLLEYQQG